MDRSELVRILFSAVDALNARLSPDRRIAEAEATPIAGDASVLESLEYVNLVLDYEARLEGALGRAVGLAERLVDDEGSEPPSTLGALADLAAKLLPKG